jgi:TolB protein
LTWGSGEIIRLTDRNPKQDGLPTISPDGKWVAFMSDRDGFWRLYYVSIDGGPVHLLSDIYGQPLSWLEHTIQWVE